MTESQCMHLAIQDPSLVIRASHEGLGLFYHANCECLIVDAFECTIDHRILTTCGFKYTLVQFDVLHTHSLPIDYNIVRNILCRIMFYILLIDQTIHLGTESNELSDTMTVVLVLENGPR